jgi:deoxyribose-phosphate aldolase
MSKTINRYLDAAVLYPEMARQDVREAIKTVIEYQSRTACVRPCDIDIAIEQCRGTQTDVCVVLGFPHGCGLSEVKALEAKAYIKKGDDSIGVGRQYCGSIGKVDNCQVDVFTAYASSYGYALLDKRLFIPALFFVAS